MVRVLHDAEDSGAHEKFVTWLDENPDGYYINCRAAHNMMLHGSSCYHASPNEQGSLTRHKKVCSQDRRELELWASDEPLRVCTDCID